MATRGPGKFYMGHRKILGFEGGGGGTGSMKGVTVLQPSCPLYFNSNKLKLCN